MILVDVGSSGGLQEKWLPHLDRIVPVLFDANPAEAAKLRERYKPSVVMECGLSDRDGLHKLHITRNHKCISVLEPNFDVLSHYKAGQAFEVVRRIDVNCSRFDTLHRDGQVPAPDVIKIDVQGFEYQVLCGFGELLYHCLGIELEAAFYPMYVGQKLVHDLVEFLAGFGYVLRRLNQSPNFEGDMVEVDAFFTRRRAQTRAMDPERRRKFDLLADVWGLARY